jgi:hypothetical protein
VSSEKSIFEKGFYTLFIMVCGFVGATLSTILLPNPEVRKLKQEAVERGYAEWHLIHAHTGETEFRWLDTPVPPPTEQPKQD